MGDLLMGHGELLRGCGSKVLWSKAMQWFVHHHVNFVADALTDELYVNVGMCEKQFWQQHSEEIAVV